MIGQTLIGQTLIGQTLMGQPLIGQTLMGQTLMGQTTDGPKLNMSTFGRTDFSVLAFRHAAGQLYDRTGKTRQIPGGEA